MKKKIEIEFDGEDKSGFNDVQLEELNKLLMSSILSMMEWSNPKKVTIDGNVFWLRTENKPTVKPAHKKYPVHEQSPIVMSRPKGTLSYPKGMR